VAEVAAVGTDDRGACNENKPPVCEGDDDGKGDGAGILLPSTGNPTDQGAADVTGAMGTDDGADGGGVRGVMADATGSAATDESLDEYRT
jgi:hypothetical protein